MVSLGDSDMSYQTNQVGSIPIISIVPVLRSYFLSDHVSIRLCTIVGIPLFSSVKISSSDGLFLPILFLMFHYVEFSSIRLDFADSRVPNIVFFSISDIF